MDLTSLSEITQLLKDYGVAPTRGKGQNFLVDHEALMAMVEAANLKPTDAVLEIGPGSGVLTQELATRAKKVVAVELDKKLVQMLKKTTKGAKNLEVVEGDILNFTNQELADRLGGEYQIVANLPYSITGVTLRKFLSQGPKPKRLVLMLQKEVAQRLAAKPGRLSLPGLQAQLYGEPRIYQIIKKTSFFPVPEIDSAILIIDNIGAGQAVADGLDDKKFWQLAKIGFSSPRKQLFNNLAGGLHITKDLAAQLLKKAKIGPQARAQELSVADWLRLVKNFDA